MRTALKRRRLPSATVAVSVLATALMVSGALLLSGFTGGRSPRSTEALLPDRVVPAAATPAVPVVAGTSWRALQTGGLTRHYLLATPTAVGPRPLVVLLHGLDQRTELFVPATGLVPVARAAGIVVAAPETPDASWNDGRFGPTGRDDDGFIVAMVDTLESEGLVDPDRVTLVGFSNGAAMAMELVSRHPRLAAGMVAVGGELLGGPGMPRPTAAVPTVFIHGTEDQIQPDAGRPRKGPRIPAMIGTLPTAAVFAAAAGDHGAPVVTALPHTSGSWPVSRLDWTAGTADVTLYRLTGAGHIWPVVDCPTAACATGHSFVAVADVSATRIAVELAATSRRATLARQPAALD